MNEYVLRAFQSFKPHPRHAWVFDNAAMMRQFALQIAHFPAYALPSIDKPTVLCGIVHAQGCGEIWMIVGEGFERSAPVVLEQQRALTASIYRALNLHRLEIRVPVGHAAERLWAERLGYAFETTLKRANAQGEDMAVYLWPEAKGEQA